jgi:putative Mg2+ transporter-C (MgtC) family protein
LPSLDWEQSLLRLVVAAALGAAIGLERELREREAGLRTHMLVSTGSALFTIASAYGFRDFLVNGGSVVRADPTRIAAQIVTGIGFIGAGAILRHGLSVRGITTAATLWVVAAIGLTTGAGYWSAAVITTAVVLFSLWPLRILAYHLLSVTKGAHRRIVVDLDGGASAAPIFGSLEELGVHVASFRRDEEENRRRISLAVELPRNLEPDRVVEALSGLEQVAGVRWSR